MGRPVPDVSKLRIRPGKMFRLEDHDPKSTPGLARKSQAEDLVKGNRRRLFDLQYVLYAENSRCVLVVLQAMDTGGKDGVIRHVMTGLNPQGCRVTSFKAPSVEELAHDFLWRIHKATPARGEIGIFNRSHYEDVLIVRVHDLVPRAVWSKRYEQINRFERSLAEQGVTILKFFLHISPEEQLERLEARLAERDKHWKLSMGDLEERLHWDAYTEAYEEALRRCSTEWAPWYVIPADHKWYRDAAIAQVLIETMDGMKLRYPKPVVPAEEFERALREAREPEGKRRRRGARKARRS